MDLKGLSWPLILVLGLAGLIVGAASLTGRILPLAEFAIWVLVAVAWVAVVLMRRVRRPLVTLAFAGLLTGLWKGFVQGIFAHVLVANHPSYLAYYPDGVVLADRVFFALSALPIGLAWGVLAGAVVMGVRKWRARDAAPA